MKHYHIRPYFFLGCVCIKSNVGIDIIGDRINDLLEDRTSDLLEDRMNDLLEDRMKRMYIFDLKPKPHFQRWEGEHSLV